MNLCTPCTHAFDDAGWLFAPVPDFRHVLAVLVDVLLVLDELVLNHLLQRCAARAQLRQPIDHILHQVEPVKIV